MNYPTLFQLDAKLNLGMSGGAVINLKGELVGLTTMAASPAGFDCDGRLRDPDGQARPSRRRRPSRKARRSNTASSASSADHNFTNRVFEVQPNSPAALGQLQVNDEIIAVNGKPVIDFDSLILAVNAYSAGDSVRLKIRRGDETIERTIVLAKFPVDGEVIATNRPKAVARPARRLLRPRSTIGPSARIPSTPSIGRRRRDRGRGRSPAAAAGHQERPVDPRASPTYEPDCRVAAEPTSPRPSADPQRAVPVTARVPTWGHRRRSQ